MENRKTQSANIELPIHVAASLQHFIEENMTVKGKDGAQALLAILDAFESAIGSVINAASDEPSSVQTTLDPFITQVE
jgi:hypothetical protein